MSYYCSNCNKEHKNGYNAHKKYKVDVIIEKPAEVLVGLSIGEILDVINGENEDIKVTTDDFIMDHRRIERLENIQETIIAILKAWKGYIDRKHPYANHYQPLFEVFELLD